MKPTIRIGLVCAMFTVAGLAQATVYIDDNNPASGVSNGFPWGQANGFTTIHFYTAAQLTAGGVLPGSVLQQVEVAPSSGTSGVYSCPMARLVIGHVPVAPVPTLWEANIVSPTVVHDLGSGPYTFPWIQDVWTPLPGISAAAFVWNGVDDIGLFYTSSAGTTGTFRAHRTSTNLRHALNIFGATNQTPQSDGNFAMKVGLTFQPLGTIAYQTNQPAALFTADGTASNGFTPGLIQVSTASQPLIDIQSTNAGLGWELIYSIPDGPVPLATVLPASGQILNIDVRSPRTGFLNNLTLPPFPGPLSFPLSSSVPFSITGQVMVLDPTNPDNLALSSAVGIAFF